MVRRGAALRRDAAILARIMSGARQLARWLVPAIVAVGVCSCASISEKLAGTMSEAPVVGVPTDTPARPADAMDFPAVHDMPPQRNSVLLTAIEQKKFEDDLLAARDEQQKRAGTAPAAASKQETAKKSKNLNRKETRKDPAPPLPSEPGYIQPSSGRTIY
jgi:hypothetical protein